MRKFIVHISLLILIFFSLLCFIWNNLTNPNLSSIIGMVIDVVGIILALISFDDWEE